MDKVAALVKTAEVNGVLAALIDADRIKLASDQDFPMVADAIASSLPEDYTMEDMLNKTAEVMEDVYEIYKVAADEDEEAEEEAAKTAALAEIGVLALAKEAGEISEQEFAKEAASVSDAWKATKAGVRSAGAYLNEGFRARGASAANATRESRRAQEKLNAPWDKPKFLNKDEAKGYARGIGQLAAAYGLAGAGAAGAGLGGHAAYKKYKGK